MKRLHGSRFPALVAGAPRVTFSFVRLRAAALALVAAAATARAQDRFEIQVYDAETAAANKVGVELHANTGGDGLVRLTAEPHLGLLGWAEVGAYLQTAIVPHQGIDWAGWKARVKLRVPRRLARDVIGLAVNAEFSSLPARYEANRQGSEIRPILDVKWKRLYASVNPIVTIDLAGAQAGRPAFEPAAKIALVLDEHASVGAEYYGAFGPFGAFLPLAAETHRVLGALDLHFAPTGGTPFGVNLGAGYEFAGAASRWIAKAIVGVGY